MQEQLFVRASEIGDFVYCNRGWWLRFKGKLTQKTEAMIEGTYKHEMLSQHVEKNQQNTQFAWILIAIATIIMLVCIALFFLLK